MSKIISSVVLKLSMFRNLIISPSPVVSSPQVSSPITIIPTASYAGKNESKSAVFKVNPYKLHKLDKGPPDKATLTADEAIDSYAKMVYCRRLENACDELYKEKIIRGFCHLYPGQEAVAIGMRSQMDANDSLITAYRCHAWTWLMGVSALGLISELAGRNTGIGRGKGGSIHMYTKNFYGGNGIVGAQCALGVGAAFAHKYKNDGGACFTIYGDGAANQGQLFEGMNIAKLWNLPCIFVCENNKYGLGTSAHRSSASTDYYTRGDYIPGIWVDGQDVLTSRNAARFALDYCKSGKGPIVLEMETYRYFGHSMSDPGTTYRTRDEVKEVRKTRDPILIFKEKILSASLVTAEKLKEIEKGIRTEIEAVVKQAKTDPEIPLSELAADIYYTWPHKKIRGILPTSTLEHQELAVRK